MRIMSANTFMRPGSVKTKLWGWAWGSSFSNSTVRRSPVWATKRATLKCMLGYIPIFTMRALPVPAAASGARWCEGRSRGSFLRLGRVAHGETTGSDSVAAAGAVLTGTAKLLLLPHLNQRHVEHADDQEQSHKGRKPNSDCLHTPRRCHSTDKTKGGPMLLATICPDPPPRPPKFPDRFGLRG